MFKKLKFTSTQDKLVQLVLLQSTMNIILVGLLTNADGFFDGASGAHFYLSFGAVFFVAIVMARKAYQLSFWK